MSARPQIFAYVSGHGYGHLMRSLAVFERVRDFADLHVRTNEIALPFARGLYDLASVEAVDLGPGVVQLGPLEGDLVATRRELEAHFATWDETVRREVDAIHAAGASLVYADVPPIAFEIAARAGIASVGMTNFSWSWIYEGIAAESSWFQFAATKMRAAELRATRLLELEIAGGVEHFPDRKIIPPVARRVSASRETLRSSLGFAADDMRPIVLVSFGGYGARLDLVAAAAKNPAYRFLLVEPTRHSLPENVRVLARDPHRPHHEIVAVVDCMVSKMGYGTFAECLAQPTPIVYVPRRQFREYHVLKAATERWLPHALLSEDEFVAGAWSAAIAHAMASKPRESPPRAEGAEVAAREIRAMLQAQVPQVV